MTILTTGNTFNANRQFTNINTTLGNISITIDVMVNQRSTLVNQTACNQPLQLCLGIMANVKKEMIPVNSNIIYLLLSLLSSILSIYFFIKSLFF